MFLTVKEVAEKECVTVQTVRIWCRDGKVSAVKLDNKDGWLIEYDNNRIKRTDMAFPSETERLDRIAYVKHQIDSMSWNEVNKLYLTAIAITKSRKKRGRNAYGY